MLASTRSLWLFSCFRLACCRLRSNDVRRFVSEFSQLLGQLDGLTELAGPCSLAAEVLNRADSIQLAIFHHLRDFNVCRIRFHLSLLCAICADGDTFTKTHLQETNT